MDAISEIRLAQVHPLLSAKVHAMASVLEGQGIIIRVVQGLRTATQQDELYAQGRTRPGPVVTDARGGYSMHNFGLAVDCIPGIRGKEPWQPNWEAKHPDYGAMIAAGEAQGLVSGAHWESIPDEPHFQLPGVPVTPTDAMRTMLSERGMDAIWSTIPPEVSA
jgi:peptidoglycan L-alanyl-D-glutamate endopeptidase CwlK